jgi:hypothetical protein
MVVAPYVAELTVSNARGDGSFHARLEHRAAITKMSTRLWAHRPETLGPLSFHSPVIDTVQTTISEKEIRHDWRTPRLLRSDDRRDVEEGSRGRVVSPTQWPERNPLSLLAERILKAAKAGERNPVRLRARAIAEVVELRP